MKKKNIKAPTLYRTVLVLLCLMVVSTYMVGGLYARFSTNSSGVGNVGVAKFDVSAQCQYNSATGEYILTVTNNSDVAVRYSFNTGALPEGVSIEMNDIGNNNILSMGESANHTVTVSDEYLSVHDTVEVDFILSVEQVD